jgi:hypothetical protein
MNVALKEWRRPRKYKQITSFGPRDIYQVDAFNLRPLWRTLFGDKFQYEILIRSHAIACVDIYSRYCLAASMKSQGAAHYMNPLKNILKYMGIPKIIQGDNEIEQTVNLLKKEKPKIYGNIRIYISARGETNKNAIIERVIRTLKRLIIKYVMKKGVPVSKKGNYVLQPILDEVTKEYKRKFHSRIQAILYNVFYELDSNQAITRDISYEKFDVGDFVIIRAKPERSSIPLGVFDADYDLYVIIGQPTANRYYVRPLCSVMTGTTYKPKRGPIPRERVYKPYEMRKLTKEEALEYLRLPIVQNYIIMKHAIDNYEQFLHYVNPL